MLPAGWDAMARAAERMAPTMNGQDIANGLNVLGKVETAAGTMLPAG
jgi:hypothetical protein